MLFIITGPELICGGPCRAVGVTVMFPNHVIAQRVHAMANTDSSEIEASRASLVPDLVGANAERGRKLILEILPTDFNVADFYGDSARLRVPLSLCIGTPGDPSDVRNVAPSFRPSIFRCQDKNS